MNKKITIVSVVILVLVAGGVFLWQQNQKDVRELNKNLPEGVRVVKSLLGRDYIVKNKIDGYEFKVPKEWKGIQEIEYITESEDKDLDAKVTGLGMEGLEGSAKILSLDVYTLTQGEVDLDTWVGKLWNLFNLNGELIHDNIDNFTIIKALEEKNLGGTYVYFLKNNSRIYVFNNGSEGFIREIISNGKW